MTNGSDAAKELVAARRWVAGTGLVAAVVGLAVAAWYNWPAFPVTFMWAAAATLFGGVLGFLFAIPKSGRRPVAPGAGDPGPTKMRANTNLEEVSDWVTKILIGVTLVQYNQFLAAFRDTAGTFARALSEKHPPAGGHPQTAALTTEQADLGFAMAVLVACGLGGWLYGYLMTLFSSPVLGSAMTAVERLSQEVRRLDEKVNKVGGKVEELAQAEVARREEAARLGGRHRPGGG